jgi:hypothetical protein
MANPNVPQSEIVPDFDVLKWKAETQAEILRENEGKTDAEIRERLQRVGEWWQKERTRRRQEQLKK